MNDNSHLHYTLTLTNWLDNKTKVLNYFRDLLRAEWATLSQGDIDNHFDY